jgi:uncharacterized membrane protein
MASQKQGARGQGSAGGARTGKPNAARSGSANAPAARSGSAKAPAARSGPANAAGRGRPGQGAAGPARTAGNAAKAARSGSPASRNSAAAATLPGGPAGAGRVGRLPLGPFRGLTTLQVATLLLSLFGLGVSIYLTIAHYDAQVVLLCSDKGFVNCAEVTTSPTSMVFGIFPVAVLGLAFYVFMTVINSPWAWRWQASRAPGVPAGAAPGGLATQTVRWVQSHLPWIRLGSLVVGMCFVLYLIYAEIIDIGAICLWCTSVHVATFLLFTLIVFDAAFSWGRADTGRLT